MNNSFNSPGSARLREYTLVAQEVEHELQPGLRVKAWSFGGTVPGTPVRITQGYRVRVTLQNQLPEPVTIHWHGVRVPNAMDGVPGVTQNAIQPGNSFVYEFEVQDPGTYWYHSHQKSAEQVDKGLYGPLIVDPLVPEQSTLIANSPSCLTNGRSMAMVAMTMGDTGTRK